KRKLRTRSYGCPVAWLPRCRCRSGNLATRQLGHHSQIHPSAMNHATSTIFTTASGKKTFQPTRIRMSYLSRGIVQRTQTKTNNRTETLITKEIAERRKPMNVAGSLYQGMSQPPRNRVVTRADMVAMAIYSDMKNSANFMDEYS